jgi:RNA polymerase sigma-70 factor (ECF subfamily)
MNLLAAQDIAKSGCWLDDMIEWLAGSFPERVVHDAMAVGNAVAGILANKIRTDRPTSLASSSVDRKATHPQTEANQRYSRFQRDIVPHLDAAYNFARFLSRNPDAAQDIVQESFLRAYRGFDGYQGGDPRAWIFTIVRNCYQDWLLDRRRKTRLEFEAPAADDRDAFSIDDVASDDDSPEDALIRTAEQRAVRAVLDKLPRALREMLVLRELEGLSYRQIAETSALPIGTVMSRLARARAQFEIAWRQEIGPLEHLP